MTEEPATDDAVIGTVQFEEEWFADLKSAELLLPAGLPEIDFVEPVQAGQKVEPITIRDSDEAHTFSCEQIKRQPNSMLRLPDLKVADFHHPALT